MNSVVALLRLLVIGVRRGAGLYLFICVIALGMGAVHIVVRDVMPHARDVGVQWAFKDTRDNFVVARAALKQKRFAGCVANPVPNKVMQIVCSPKELMLIEAMLTFMLWLGLAAAALAKTFWVQGLACIGLRFVFDRVHAKLVARRKAAFAAMIANPYSTAAY